MTGHDRPHRPDATAPPPARHGGGDQSNRERAISDLVGYVLMVGVIFVGVGLTATIGVDHIESAQLDRNVEGVERAMELLEGNVDEIQTARSSVRTTSLSVSSGSIAIEAGAGSTAVTVNVSGGGDSPTTYRMGSVTYRFDGGAVAYEGGGVFRRTDAAGSTALVRAAPTFICRDDRAIVSIVTLQGPATGRSFSGGSIQLQVRENASRTLFPKNRTGPGSLDSSTGVNVTIENSGFAGGWGDYMEASDQEWATDSGTSWDYRCEPPGGGPMPVYVRQTVVNMTVGR